ncbi:hypothetical protein GQ53DRAFT_825631 [Thozetella sp. PMI_491]|nr:hypothetical protein GQ53DRAFT_825631 [Thozetella sp. PMI_491]
MGTAAAGGAAKQMLALDALTRLTVEDSPAKLEAGAVQGLRLLQDIKTTLSSAKDNVEVSRWIKNIEDVEELVERKRVVVGVRGSTGAGKSSVINALLDEESLVPTNCMRACTAVITEIAYNNSPAPEDRYRAEIEFITEKEWRDELTILFSDLFGSQDRGLSTDLASEDSEAGIAYAKLRAVYPELTKRDILDRSEKMDLATTPAVAAVLGTTHFFGAPTPGMFTKLMHKFIDSKETTSSRIESAATMELWPLIKVVKVYVKHPVLETGLVIVDLPGVHDSNAARSKVASKYQEQCTGTWVVAPITRAVDDKTAHELMGDSFRRQMQLDGGFADITMICSKTDHISVTETLKSLPVGDSGEAHEISDWLGHLNRSLLTQRAEVQAMKQRLADLHDLVEEHDQEIEVLEAAVEHAANDQVSFPETPKRKRKQRTTASASRKRTQGYIDDDDDSNSSSSNGDELDVSDPEEQSTQNLSLKEAREKLEELKERKKKLREERDGLAQHMKPARKEEKRLKHQTKELTSQRKRLCIQYRNNYSRPSIRSQFAAGIRELDEDKFSQDDEELADASYLERDYEELAASLPVFCVSSHAWLKMLGKLEKDDPVSGFRVKEDTEIPQLQAHAQGLTQAARAESCRQFFSGTMKILHSLMIQLVMTDSALQVADELKKTEQAYLEGSIAHFRKELETAREAAIKGCRKLLQRNILGKIDDFARLAAHDAPCIVESWGASREAGGLAFQTYRATCVREGRFKGAKGPRDFNEELADLLKKKVVRGWERTFVEAAPARIDEYGEALAGAIEVFHGRMKQRKELVKQPSFRLLESQNKTWCATVRDTTFLKALIVNGQRDANREFTPAVTEKMAPVYTRCARESGPGSFKRMKDDMSGHIDHVRRPMYRTSTCRVRLKLEELVRTLDMRTAQDIQRIGDELTKDYANLISDHNIFKVLSTIKGTVQKLLSEADQRFTACLLAEMRAMTPESQPAEEDKAGVTTPGSEDDVADTPAKPIKREHLPSTPL